MAEKLASVDISFPVPENRANASGHSKFKHWNKQAYIEQCSYYLQCLYTHRSSFPFEAAVWIGKVEVYNNFDYDNLMALFKWPIDALKTYGIIIEDGIKFFKPLQLPTQVIKRDGTERKLHMTLFRSQPFMTEKELKKYELKKAGLGSRGQSKKETSREVEKSKRRVILG